VNRFAGIVLLLVFTVLLGAPLLMRRAAAPAPAEGLRLVVITPHNEQLRYEIGRGFRTWHEREFGEPAVVDWRRPGGTSEIRRQLQAQYRAAIEDGRIGADGAAPAGAMPYDVMLGGGSYEHQQLKLGVRVSTPKGEAVSVALSAPCDFSDARLEAWFGENRVGASALYDPEKHWIGTALSSFGILYNRDQLDALDLPEPTTWEDLTHPGYASWLAVADPRHSGSIATTYDSILSNYGWEKGWRILRGIAANARYFSTNSARPVIDLSRGEAAAGLCIDFYGRYQAQALRRRGGDAHSSRLAYVEPARLTFVDPDPVSILRGGPSPDLAHRFVEFLLSVEGQALWQFPAVGPEARADALGPERFELRRLPARRVMYERYFDRFIDQANPFEIASTAEPQGWRGMISPLFSTFAIDIHDAMHEAWRAMHDSIDAGATVERIKAMREAFYALPDHPMPDGRTLPFTKVNYSAIRNDWRDDRRAAELRIIYMRFFESQYAEVVRLAEAAMAPEPS